MDILKENIEDIYPMSDIQQGMIMYSIYDPNGITYVNKTGIVFNDRDFNEGLFYRAIELLIEKHGILRTVVNLFDFEKPVQILLKKYDPQIKIIDGSKLTNSEITEIVNKIYQSELQSRFKNITTNVLWSIHLIKLQNNDVFFFMINHHVLLDGWSATQFITELNNTYLRLKVQNNYIPAKLKSSYKDYVISQIYDNKNTKSLEFWQKELTNFTRLNFYNLPNSIDENQHMKVYKRQIDPDKLSKLHLIAQKTKISIQNISFAAYLYSIYTISCENDFIVGIISHNRPIIEDSEKILGCFLNTIPFKAEIPDGILLFDYLKIVDRKLTMIKAYDRVTFSEITKNYKRDYQGQNPLTDLTFNFLNLYNVNELKRDQNLSFKDDSEIKFKEVDTINTYFNFTVGIYNGFRIFITYSKTFIPEHLVQKFCDSFEQVVNLIIEENNILLRRDLFLSEKEKYKILFEFNNTAFEYPKEKTIIDLFEEQVEKTPGNIALIFQGDKYTYLEFRDKIKQTANYLLVKGIINGDIVGLMSDRSIEMMVGIYAILKIGGVYLPIDPNYPENRIKYILENSKAKTVLYQEKYKDINTNLESISIESREIRDCSKKVNTSYCSSNDLAYIIYTSGSTGDPKGVMIEHHSLVNRINWMGRTYPISHTDVFMQKTTIVFDVSVWELFWWAIEGAALFLLNPQEEKQPTKIIKAIEENKVSIIHFVPSMLHIFLEELNNGVNYSKLETLRYVFSSGEALTKYDVVKFNKNLLKENGTKLVNLYGPTEATIDVSYFDCFEQEEYEVIPIGKPIDNIELYIVDKNNKLLPIGVPGELCISGVGLARGYINNEKLTKEKFVACPFQNDELMYKTGDLACWLSDGNIEFLGRIDNQVKIHGFRIELGEIENRLLENENVKEAVVITHKLNKDDIRLVAFIVNNDTTNGILKIKKYLKEYLPDYMVPSFIIKIDELPLTTNGKIDRNSLIRKINYVSQVNEEYVEPKTEIEKQIATIWKEVIGIERVSLNDSFFDLGGNSFLLLKNNEKIEKLFNIEVPFTEYFGQTLEQIAKSIEEKLIKVIDIN